MEDAVLVLVKEALSLCTATPSAWCNGSTLLYRSKSKAFYIVLEELQLESGFSIYIYIFAHFTILVSERSWVANWSKIN